MSGLHFDVTADTSNFNRKLQEIERRIGEFSSDVEEQGMSIDELFQRMAKAAAAMGVAFSAKEFVQKVAQVRGEFQKLEVAFNTMLGSEQKASALMGQLVETAAITPFGLQDVANGAKQLLAYGLASEKVNDTLTRLGDIAAGLSIPLNDLTYLYGTTMVQGRMYTQDLNQFLGRGIPLTEELAKQFGVTSDKVKDLVTEGKVGFPEVEKAIVSLTSEGGKFGGLMAEQSKTITGQIGNIEDAIETMFNEIGKQSEGIINAGLSITSALVENWQKVGEAIGVAVTAYGTYKAVVMSVAAVHRYEMTLIKQAVVEKKLAAAANTVLSNSEAVAAAKTKLLALAQQGLAQSLKAVASATLLNPYVLITAAITGLIYAIYKAATAESAAEKAMKAYNEEKQKAIEAEQKHREEVEKLISAAEDEAASTEVRHDALMKLEKYYPSIFAKYETEYDILKNIKKIKEEIAKEDAKNSITNLDNELYNVNKEINALEARGKKNAKEREYNGGLLLSVDERARLQALKTQRDTIQRQQKAKSAEDYFADLAGISNEELQRQVNKRKTILADLKHTGKEWGAVTGEKNTALNGAFRKGDIEAQKNALERELNKRNQKTNTGQGWTEEAKKQYERDLKAYNDFISDKTSKLTQEEFEKRRDELKAALDASKKVYDASKKQNLANTRGEADEYRRLAEKNAKERIRSEQDLQMQVDEAKIAAMAEGRQKSMAALELNFEKEMQEIDRQKEDALLKKKELARAEFEKNPANKGKKFDESSVTLSNEEVKQFDELYKASMGKYERERSKLMAEDAKYMHDYLEEFGTFQEQKFAIAQKYAKKIAEIEKSDASDNEKGWQIKSVRKEQKAAMDNVDAQAVMARIDWYQVFGNVGNIMSASLRSVLGDLKQYTKTDAFNNLGAEQQKSIVEAMDRIRSQVGDNSDIGWKNLAEDLTAYQTAIREAQTASQEYSDMELEYIPKMQEAQKKLNEAKKDSDPNKIQEAQDELNELTKTLAESGEKVATANGKVRVSGTKLAQTTQAVIQPIDEIHNFLQTTGLSELQSLWDGFNQIKGAVSGLKAVAEASDGAKEISDATKDTADALGDAGKVITDSLSSGLSKAGLIGQIIAAILKILDVLKDGIGPIISSLIDSILGAISGIIENVLSGDLFKQLGKSLYNGIAGIFDSIIGTIGSWFGASGNMSDWFTRSNAKAVAETTERLTDENEKLRNSVDNLKNEMSKQSGSKALTTYNEAVSNQRRKQSNQMDILMAQMGYHDAHHSNEAYWNDPFSGFVTYMDKYLSNAYGIKTNYELINDILSEYSKKNPNAKLKRTFVESLYDMYELTPEQMNYIRTYNVDLWKEITSVGKYDKSEYWDAYADLAGEMEEITDAFKESITQISFDSLRDEFVNTLMDMDASASDFSDDFKNYLMKAVLSAKVSDLLEDEMEAFYDKWAKYAQSDNSLDDKEIKELQSLWDELTAKGLNIRDEVAKITGYTGSESSSQSASTKGFEAMSQDTADELNGRFTALQESNEDIKNQMIAAVEASRSLLAVATDGNGLLNSILLQQVTTNSHLEDISKYVKPVLEIGGKLDKIINNTKNL